MFLNGTVSSVKTCRAATKLPCVKAPATAVRAVAQGRKPRDAREENVPGDFYVDGACIDCDTCRWMAPESFGRANNQSAIHTQPLSQDARKRALQALLACPVFSIHTRHQEDGELGAALDELPLPVPGTSNLFHLVMASEASYGAAAYLIRHPSGNIMVDSPRFDKKLLKRIQGLGGAKYMFMTHKDDVGHHEQWAEALGCQRIMHLEECNTHQGTDKVEIKLEGHGPWKLPDGNEDLELVFTPGHSSAHIAAFYKPERALFSGDHWGYNGFEQRGTLHRRYNHCSLDQQMDSLAKLKALDFVHVLPGHGRRMSFKDRAAKDAYIDLTVQAEREEGQQAGAAESLFASAHAENPALYRAVLAEQGGVTMAAS